MSNQNGEFKDGGVDSQIFLSSLEGDAVAEFTQQLASDQQFIYNARHENAVLVIENLGLGDIYVNEKGYAVVGEGSCRLQIGEQRSFIANRLFFTAASQPVLSIIEVVQPASL